MTAAYWDESYPPEVYDQPTPAPATGAVAGTPGTWTPPGSTPPSTLADLLAADPPIVASPGDGWVDGQNVPTGTDGPVYWDGATWAAGVAPAPTPPAVTGATAGTPGDWTPAGSTPPATLDELLDADPAVVASPSTEWTEGQNVETGDGDAAYWDGIGWAAGAAPAPDEPEE